MKMTLFITAVLLAFLLFSSCTAIRKPPRYDLEKADGIVITEKMRSGYGKIENISGRFDFSYSTERGIDRSWGNVTANRNDTLYVEILGLAGGIEAEIFIDRDSLIAKNHSRGMTVRDISDENSFYRITGMNFNVSDIRRLLFVYGRDEKFQSITSVSDEKLTFRSVTDDQRYSFVTLDDRMLVVRSEDYFERDLVSVREYDYYSHDSGFFYPRRIRIRTYNPPSRLTVFFTRLSVNGNKKER